MPIQIEVRHDAMGVVYHCRGAMIIDDFFAANESFLATQERSANGDTL